MASAKKSNKKFYLSTTSCYYNKDGINLTETRAVRLVV
jgi:hypothetical protein